MRKINQRIPNYLVTVQNITELTKVFLFEGNGQLLTRISQKCLKKTKFD